MSVKLAVIFSEGYARKFNTDTNSVSRCLVRLKAKQVSRGELESIVHEELCYKTQEFNEFANSFKQKFEESV